MTKRKAREVSFGNLMFHVLKHWRSIILSALFFTLVFGAISYKNTMPVKGADSDMDLSSGDTLDEESMAKITKITDYEAALDQLKEYADKFLLYKADATSLPTSTLIYNLGVSNEENVGPALSCYGQLLNGGEFYEEIAGAAEDITAAQVKDLVNHSIISSSDKNEKLNRNSVLQITVRSADKQSNEKLTNAIMAYIPKMAGKLTAYGNITAALIENSYMESMNYDLLQKQNDMLNQINNMDDTVKNMKKALSEAESAYLNNNVIEVKDVENDPDAKASVSLLFCLVGFIWGFFVWTVILCLNYLGKKKLLPADKMEQLYNIDNLGKINFYTKEKSLFSSVDRKIERWANKNYCMLATKDMADMVFDTIRNAALEKKETTVVALCGVLTDAQMEIMASISKNLQKEGIHLNIYNNEDKYKGFYNYLKDAKAAILVKTANRTSFADVDFELEVLGQMNIGILGYVMLQELNA